MSVIRAIFWIGLVVLMLPRATGVVPTRASQGAACAADMNTCIHEQENAASLRDLFLSRIAQVKHDLAAQ